jgi:DNA-directed RNA polymerase alpha subunit
MDAILKERIRMTFAKIEIALGLCARNQDLRNAPNIDRARKALDDLQDQITCDDDDEDTPLELLGLTPKTCYHLYEAGIISVEQLAKTSTKDLLQLEYIRQGRICEIDTALAAVGINRC